MSTLIRNTQGLEKNYQSKFLLNNLKSLHVWEHSNYKRENIVCDKRKLKNLSTCRFHKHVPSNGSICDHPSNNRATHIIGKKKTLTHAYET